MIQRCTNSNNPGYKNYGGRGIKMCWSWRHSFWFFRRWALNNGYDDTLTIERVDNDGNYDPRNCTWVPFEQQARNTRRTHWVTAYGETKCIAEWAEDERCRVSYTTIRLRLENGWRPEAAISSLPRPGNRPTSRNAVMDESDPLPALIAFNEELRPRLRLKRS
jgi:hypothetical protein